MKISLSLANLALLVAVSVATFAPRARAQAGLDDASQKALEQTKALLTDRKQLDALSKTDKNAAAADQQVKLLMGNQADTDAVYQLSADIFQDVVTRSNGDPEVMQKMLAEAMKNPAAFAAKLSPEQKAKIGELGQRVDSRKSTAVPH